MTFTGKKNCRTSFEVKLLLDKLNHDGFRWASGQNLSSGSDTNYCIKNTPLLIVLDARHKLVYYSSDININIEIDPNYR